MVSARKLPSWGARTALVALACRTALGLVCGVLAGSTLIPHARAQDSAEVPPEAAPLPAPPGPAPLAPVPDCEVGARTDAECNAAGCVNWDSVDAPAARCCRPGRRWLSTANACGNVPDDAARERQPRGDSRPNADTRGHVWSELQGSGVSLLIDGLLLALTVAACGPDDDGVALCLMLFSGPLMGIVSLVGVPLGVYLAGNHAGGDGSFWASFLGNFIGIGLGTAVVWVVADAEGGFTVPLGLAVVAGLALEFAGAILGYELTCTPDGEATTGGTAVHIVPSVALLPDGASFGVMGAF